MKRFLKSLVVIILFSAIQYSCDTKQNIDREAIKKEMKSREITRITDSEIRLEGERVGKLLVDGKTEELTALLEKYQVKTDTIKWADSVQDSVFNSIKEVYQYASESNLAMPEGIQAFTDKLLFFCQPLQDSSGYTGVNIISLPKKQLIMNYKSKD